MSDQDEQPGASRPGKPRPDEDLPPQQSDDHADDSGGEAPDAEQPHEEASDEAPERDEGVPPDESPGEPEEEPPPEAPADEEDEEETKDVPVEGTEEGAPAAAPREETEQATEEVVEPGPPPPQYDGLDSGLAWFGEEPFLPPSPPGYVAAEPSAVAPPAEAVAVRKQRVRERFEARRKEVEAARRWYQRIPIPILLSLPAAIFIIVWILFVARPWRRIPDPSQKLDPSLLEAEPLEDQGEKLRALKVVSSSPLFCWEVLPGNILRMDELHQRAHIELEPPEEPAGFELTCDVCIAEERGYEYAATLLLDDQQGISLLGNQYSEDVKAGQERRKTGIIRAVRIDVTTRGQWTDKRPLKLGYWYRMRIRAGADASRFYLNGRRMTQGGPQRPNVALKPALHVRNARVLLRNFAVKPIE